jgi:SNF2 family DNA or RNA helicase
MGFSNCQESITDFQDNPTIQVMIACQESIMDFQDNPTIQVMIALLKAGGIRLDLTMVNKCILVEPWWNDAIQQLAFCRLFRIGQTRSVEIIKLVVKDTIDDYMLELQGKKNKEIDSTIGMEALSSMCSMLNPWLWIVDRGLFFLEVVGN